MSTLIVIGGILIGFAALVAGLYYTMKGVDYFLRLLRQNKAFQDSLKMVKKVVFIVAAFVASSVFLVLCAPYVFPESAWAYALRYSTHSEDVVIDHKPHDCDWDKAPVGNKECHFEKVVTVREGDESVDHHTLVYVNWEKIMD
jgi:membrane-associated PAP2 superfamily phosphatase